MIVNYTGSKPGIRPTFGGPVVTSLQTSLQELTPLRNATGISHLDNVAAILH